MSAGDRCVLPEMKASANTRGSRNGSSPGGAPFLAPTSLSRSPPPTGSLAPAPAAPQRSSEGRAARREVKGACEDVSDASCFER